MALFGPKIMPLWLKSFNFLAQPQGKDSLNHLSSTIEWKVKAQRLWNFKPLLSTNAPLNFILVTLPNKKGHFCHLGNYFLQFMDTHLHRENRIRWSFPFEKTTRRFEPLWIFRWGYVRRNSSFLPRQRLDFKVSGSPKFRDASPPEV